MTSVETAIQMIVEKTKAVWRKPGKWIATVLSLDVEGAFDNVSHDRLLHNLRKRRVPEDMTRWIQSFLSDRSTFISMENETSEAITKSTGISKELPLSPIFYLFDNAHLLEACIWTAERTSSLSFIDDVNIFTFDKITEEENNYLFWAKDLEKHEKFNSKESNKTITQQNSIVKPRKAAL